jgi:hypothetical protein
MSRSFASRLPDPLRQLLRRRRRKQSAPPPLERHRGSQGEPDFVFINPPFNVNSAKYAHIPPEVTGNYLLKSMLKRIGWASLSGRNVLDYGCGVRMTRTIINLGVDVGHYHGVDVNRELINWLCHYVSDSRFSFQFVDDHNPMYNPAGTPGGGLPTIIEQFSENRFDLVYSYSLITHADPREARRIFETARSVSHDATVLYFTAFLDDRVTDYTDAGELPRSMCAYSLKTLAQLLEQTGWRMEGVYPGSFVQQPAILCRAL